MRFLKCRVPRIERPQYPVSRLAMSQYFDKLFIRLELPRSQRIFVLLNSCHQARLVTKAWLGASLTRWKRKLGWCRHSRRRLPSWAVRRICTISCATENCKNTVQQIDVLCGPCHKRVPKKLKAVFCIIVGVGDRVCGREIFRVNRCIKCYYKPEAKMREEEKAARPKCNIKGMINHRSRLFPASSNIKIWGKLLLFFFLVHPSLFLRAGVPCTIP